MSDPVPVEPPMDGYVLQRRIVPTKLHSFIYGQSPYRVLPEDASTRDIRIALSVEQGRGSEPIVEERWVGPWGPSRGPREGEDPVDSAPPASTEVTP